MEVVQIYKATNNWVEEMTGKADLLNEDLSNIVQVGTEIFNATSFDNFSRRLMDHVGRVVFVDRVYRGQFSRIMKRDWVWGGALEKIDAAMPVALENQNWMLNDGQSYDDHIFYGPKLNVKIFQDKVTFAIARSITREQVESGLSGVEQWQGLISMLGTKAQNAIEARMEMLARRADNSMIARTLADAFPAGDYSGTSSRAINLLNLYKAEVDAESTLTPEAALVDLDFLKFAAFKIGKTLDRMSRMSTIYNIAGADRFTPKEYQRLVLLSDFARAADVYLQSDTFHETYTSLPDAEVVPYLQDGGEDNFATNSAIDVTIDGDKVVNTQYIVGYVADIEAVWMSQLRHTTSSNYTMIADFTSFVDKITVGLANDNSENFVVFYLA